ncbi:MAG: divalent metal cation transporter [Myxococcales bacterium]|nr:divalent metal cation transporter [Myxococcales bacterium]
MASRGVLAALGPGLLFSAAAVGVSHLVQSTRAGADYGLALLGLVVLANLVKYPAFRFGPHYAAATGTSLLEGYRRQGRGALVIYGLATVGTMFTVQAAVTVVTAGLAIQALGLPKAPVAVSAALLAGCGALLALGRYKLLDGVAKALVAVLTVSTLAAAIIVLPRVDPSTAFDLQLVTGHPGAVFFLAALVGWMPSAIDVAVWQSLWTLARRAATGHTPTVRESMVDFHIGYIGTAALALCFVVMGAGVLFGQPIQLSDSPAGFAGQIVQMYEQTLGAWAGPLVGVAAFAVMLSTTLTVLDGFPRALVVLRARWRGPEVPGTDELESPDGRRAYFVAMLVLALGSVGVLLVLLTSLKALVDVATTLSFLTAPVLAALNHRAIHAAEVPEEHRPGPALRVGSLVGVALQAIFALGYLVLRYG